MAPPEPGPFPPADLAQRALPIDTISAGTRLFRLHRNDLGALFFGATGHNRFDDPAGRYGVCYLATTVEGAFAETCLRAVGARFVAFSFLEERSCAEIEVTTPIHLASLHGSGLAGIGATAAVTSGPHAVARRWSRAIHDHRQAPDGISYRSNHDNGEVCVCLFERARGRLQVFDTRPLTLDRNRLAGLLGRYKVGLG